MQGVVELVVTWWRAFWHGAPEPQRECNPALEEAHKLMVHHGQMRGFSTLTEDEQDEWRYRHHHKYWH